MIAERNQLPVRSNNEDEVREEYMITSADYYLARDGQVFGPADLTTIGSWIGEKRITTRDWLFVPAAYKWVPILDVPGMAGCFNGMAESPQNLTAAERRQWCRLPVNTSMTFSFKDDPEAPYVRNYVTSTVNISEGGLAFQWKEPLQKGSGLKLAVDLCPEMLRADFTVTRNSRRTDGQFVVGGVFENMSQFQIIKIRKFARYIIHSAARHQAPGEPPRS